MFGVLQFASGCASANGEDPVAGPAGSTPTTESPTLPGAPAADSPTDAKDTARAGSRLRVRYTTLTHAGEDGSRHTSRSFAGWFDTQRNEPCSAQLGSDGKTRCYPQNAPLPYYYSTFIFSDSACKAKNIVYVEKKFLCTTPAYVQAEASPASEEEPTVCSFAGPALRKVVKTVTRGFRLDEKSRCVEQTIAADSVALELSDILPASEFVLFTETTEDK